MRSLAIAAAAIAVVGCSRGDPEPSPAGSPTELLARAQERLREQATLTFESTYTRTRADRPDDPERYAEGEGALDLAARWGRLTFELDVDLPTSESQPDPLADPITLRWDRSSLEAELGERRSRVDRAEARDDGALLGALPDELEGLIGLLDDGRDERRLDDDEIDDYEVAHVAFTVEARAAGRAGVPAELRKAFEQALYGPELALDAWIDGGGLPRRLGYTVELEPVRREGKLILPARTVEVVYDLAAFGEPVSGLEFESQAG